MKGVLRHFRCFQRVRIIFDYLPESIILLELIDRQDLHGTEASGAQVLLALRGQVPVVPPVHLNNSFQLERATELREISL